MWQRWNQGTHIFEKSTDNGVNWSPLGLNASIITEGTLVDARLSANVALKNVANVFSQPQTISHPQPRLFLANGNNIDCGIENPTHGLELVANTYWNGSNYVVLNSSFPSWILRLTANSDAFSVYRAPSGGSVAYSQLLSLDNLGKIYERARGIAIGQIQSWSPVGTTNEGAAIGGSIGAAYYAVIGNMIFWSIYCINFTIPAITPLIKFTGPPGYVPWNATTENSPTRVYIPGVGDSTAAWTQISGTPTIDIYLTGRSWPAGVGHFIGQGHYFFQ